MADKSKRASLLRKIFVSVALIALLGLFLTLYYFVYIPQQQIAYNKSSFRILKEISDNFKDRVQGVTTAAEKNQGVLGFQKISRDTTNLRAQLISAITIPAVLNKSSSTNSLPFLVGKRVNDSVKRTIQEIFQPIVELHSTNFESVILIKTDSFIDDGHNTGTIVYNSSNLALDDAVNIDSIYKKRSFFVYPATFDIEIESVDYKLYTLPFSIFDQRFIIGGFVSNHNYKVGSRSFPVLPLIILAVLLVVILTSLPFLKIFLLSPQESISVKDVRSIIAMIYIIPFIFIILISCVWLYTRAVTNALQALTQLHGEVSRSFYSEVDQALHQLKYYDSSLQPLVFDKEIKPAIQSLANDEKASLDLKDAALHPQFYKNFDGLFWIDSSGQEIAKWNFKKDSVYFFNKSDRQYVQDIKRHEGYVLPEPYSSDTFSIQPILAKSSGEYTVSIVTASNQDFGSRHAIMVGLSGNLYSLFNPVVPKGVNFCIIDRTGKTLFHSEYRRNLQENLFEEVRNSVALKTAINRKDSVMLDLKLYEKDVHLLVTPLKGLPYYLVIYSNKRDQILHVFHMVGFTFLTQSLLLLIIALISLFFYYSNSKFSQLFFTENDLEFAKPSELKEEYYKNLVAFHISILVLSIVMSLVFTGKEWLFFVLNLSIQLPLFSIIGYYLLRCLENNCAIIVASRKNNPSGLVLLRTLFNDRNIRRTIAKILVPYVFVVTLFQLNKNALFNTSPTTGIIWINAFIILLEILVPVLAIGIKIFGVPFLKRRGTNKVSETSFQRFFVKALLLSAVMTTIVPVIGLLLYAGHQEKMLQLKSRQMYEAQKIQDRRTFVNSTKGNTKLGAIPAYHRDDSVFIQQLKYSTSHGLYLGSDLVYTSLKWSPKRDSSFADFGLYKAFTQFLFLPPDHPDFFNNKDYYYFWKDSSSNGDSSFWNFHYRNASDYKDKSHLVISSKFTITPTTFSLFRNSNSILLLFIVILFVYVFYKILFAVSKRLFLIGYFEHTPGKEQDVNYLNNKYFAGKLITDPFELAFWQQNTVTTDTILLKESEYENTNQKDECILKIQTLLGTKYETIWQDLSPSERFALYDMAVDSFTNYKNIDILYSLYKKGILKKKDHHLVVMNNSFRNYLATKSGTLEIAKLKEDISEGGNWGNIRTVLLVITMVVVVFLFVVQEDLSKRILAIATSLGALIPLMLKVFSKNNESTATDKK